MNNKVTKKYIQEQIKKQFKAVNIHLKLLKCFHEMALAKRDLDRAEFESKVQESVGERDFYYIKDFMEYQKAI